MVSVEGLVGGVFVVSLVAGAIMSVRRLFVGMSAVARRRENLIFGRFQRQGGYEIGGLRMDLTDIEIYPKDTVFSKAKWIVLGEIVDLDGYAEVVARLTAPNLEGDVLRNHFLADSLDIFEGPRVDDGSVEEMDDGSVQLEFRIQAADRRRINQTLRNIHDRALERSFND
jgi:hypothetical protein